jgi:predicted GTPase
MGETGAGKSTVSEASLTSQFAVTRMVNLPPRQFVNDLAGEQLASVNEGLRGTTGIDYYDILSEDGLSIKTFVDCPGYNHGDLTDEDIGSIIRKFLAKSPL